MEAQQTLIIELMLASWLIIRAMDAKFEAKFTGIDARMAGMEARIDKIQTD